MKSSPNQKISPNIPFFFKAVRKFYDLQQVEFAKKLQVSQGTISKIESGVMLPDLVLWFRFISEFSIRDPFCLYYDGIEVLEEVYLSENFEFKLVPALIAKNSKTIKAKKFWPIYTYLIENHQELFLIFLNKSGVRREVFYIFNHPLPLSFAEAMLSFLKDNKIESGADMSGIIAVATQSL